MAAATGSGADASVSMDTSSSTPQLLFEDLFEVQKVNPEGKKFHRVDRVVAHCAAFEADITFDVASELFPVKEGQRLTIALASTLRLDGKEDDADTYDQSGKKTLLDKYDYGMCGKVFRYQRVKDSPRVAVIASFGGLLMMIQALPSHLVNVHLDQRIYMLVRRATGGAGM